MRKEEFVIAFRNKKPATVAGFLELIICRRYTPQFEDYTTTSDKIKHFAIKILNIARIITKTGRILKN